MERVAREGFAMLEGQDSLFVRLFVRLGLGENSDPAGGYTYRFARRELEKVFNSVQTVSRWQIHTAWLPPGSDAVRHFSVVMDVANPVVSHPFVLRVIGNPLSRTMLRSAFNGVNRLTGRWGNSLIMVAWKKCACRE